jgi:hypothetical protein
LASFSAFIARMRHGVHMGYVYKCYELWNLDKFLRQQRGHSWKDSSKMKDGHPICGARCRDGHSCKAKAVVDPLSDEPINGRCRMHGGLSCGPKTPEGKVRSMEAARLGMVEYWRKKRATI